jgi:hypothetical protein
MRHVCQKNLTTKTPLRERRCGAGGGRETLKEKLKPYLQTGEWSEPK